MKAIAVIVIVASGLAVLIGGMIVVIGGPERTQGIMLIASGLFGALTAGTSYVVAEIADIIVANSKASDQPVPTR